MNDSFDKKWRALTVQFIQQNGCVVLKRGTTLVKFYGNGAAEVLEKIFRKSQADGATQKEIREEFSQAQYPIVQNVVEKLITKRFLIPVDGPEKIEAVLPPHLDLFYWSSGRDKTEVDSVLKKKAFFILGVNCISQRLALALWKSRIENIHIIDDPFLRNLRLYEETQARKVDKWPEERFPLLRDEKEYKTDLKSSTNICLIATSDFGWTNGFREWNRFSIEHNLHFFPVILSNHLGFVGPLVIPGETACFECLRSRYNSHALEPELQDAFEESAFEGQIVNGFHPSMASILGDIAAVELMKFYSEIPVLRNLGRLVRVSLLAPSLETSKVLKIPRCTVCSSMKTRSSMTLKTLQPKGD